MAMCAVVMTPEARADLISKAAFSQKLRCSASFSTIFDQTRAAASVA
jgi:hypothetical protein